MTTKVYIDEKVERENLDGCPVCGNPECTLDDSGYDGKEHWAAYTCDACEHEFTEIYEYKHTEYVKEVTR